jgi:hypothetical protein
MPKAKHANESDPEVVPEVVPDPVVESPAKVKKDKSAKKVTDLGTRVGKLEDQVAHLEHIYGFKLGAIPPVPGTPAAAQR